MRAQLDRHPLTARFARTVAETRRNPSDWWEGPREPSHIVAAVGAMRKLTERDLDRAQERRTLEARSRFDAAIGGQRAPAAIALDSGLVARLLRWLRA